MIVSIDDIATFCKRRGFVYPTAEIYGGLAGFFDFGPLGVELKNNIKNEFWKRFVHEREDVVGIDGSIITNPRVWNASGHVASFTDVLVECKKCNAKYRGDQLAGEQLNIIVDGITLDEINKLISEKKIKCLKCKAELSNPKAFNLMFETNIGPVKENSAIAYLRPESAQLIFTNFKLVQENSRLKLPFGIAQIGKAFRNEIAPRDFLFRMREFDQMEIEFFINPEKASCSLLKEVLKEKINVLSAEMQKKNQKEKEITIKQALDKKIIQTEWHAYWLANIYKWFIDLGIKKDNLRIREHKKEELSHYARSCFDIEYRFPFGFKEIHGNADRQQFDLRQHMNFSNADLTFYDEESKKKVTPSVIEPSQGVERAFLAFIFDAYEYDKKRENIVLHLHPKLAPIKVAVFPLVSNDKKLINKSYQIYKMLKKEFNCFYDKAGSIGRRYARMDEVGTPFCITLDFDSLKNKDVTVRNRDTIKQIRVKEKDLIQIIKRLLNLEIKFEKAGKLI